MATTLKNYKTYILIDFENDIYGFVNNPSDMNKFYEDEGIDISTLTGDVDGYLVDVFLVNVKTGEEIKIKYSSGNTLCI